MALAFLRITGFTRVDRQKMISRVERSFVDSGAWITDFKQFSNVSICISFEVSVANVPKLFSSLVSTGLQLSDESHRLLADSDSLLKSQPASRAAPVPGTLQITFIHNEPDLRMDIPAIPG